MLGTCTDHRYSPAFLAVFLAKHARTLKLSLQDHLEVHLTDEIAVKFKDFMEASSVVQNLRSDVHKLMLLVNDERSRAARLLEITDTHLKTSTALSRRQRNLLSVSELSNVSLSARASRFGGQYGHSLFYILIAENPELVIFS